MAFGKISELNELTAIRAAGINPFHIIKPVLIAGIFLSILLMWFSNYVLPDANQRARSLFIDIRLKKPGFDLKPNEFYDGIDNYTFLVKRITSESDSLHDITIYQHPTRNRKEAYIKAKHGQLESQRDGQTLTLYLKDGSILRDLDRRKKGRRVTVFEETEFDRYRISFDLSELAFSRSNPENRSRNDRTMDIKAMMAIVDSLNKEITTLHTRIQNNQTFTIPDPETSNLKPSRRIQTGPDSTEQPYQSQFIALNKLNSQYAQRAVYDHALANLRSYKSLFEEVATDTDWRIGKIARYLVEVHKKFSIPIACIVFVLLGAPLGIFTKKGNLGYAALIGVVFLTFYWISIIQGEKLADRLYISPFTGMWFSDILLGLIGAYLTIRICSSFKFSNLWKRD
jgi:lipopolysaccharide export system permease protein